MVPSRVCMSRKLGSGARPNSSPGTWIRDGDIPLVKAKCMRHPSILNKLLLGCSLCGVLVQLVFVFTENESEDFRM